MLTATQGKVLRRIDNGEELKYYDDGYRFKPRSAEKAVSERTVEALFQDGFILARQNAAEKTATGSNQLEDIRIADEGKVALNAQTRF